MADDKKNKPIDQSLEEALKEFEGIGGFDHGSEEHHEEEPEELPRTQHHEKDNEDHHNEYNEDEDFDEDFDIMQDDDNDIEDLDEENSDENTEKDEKKDKKYTKKNDKSQDGGDSGSIVDKLKQPKNFIILFIAVCFLLFLFLGGGKKKKTRTEPVNIDSEISSQVGELTTQNTPEEQPQEAPPPVKKKKTEEKQSTILSELELPSLDIKMPEIKQEDADLTPKIPEQKPKSDSSETTQPPEINIDTVPIRDKNEETNDIIEKPSKKRREAIQQKDDSTTQTLVKDLSGGSPISPPKPKSSKNGHDFIFMDTDLDTEKEDESSTISAKRIQNPENVISQGRIIDAVLETSVNSSISGQVRAIVTRDVYAEVGRNILIPKGTRLYGEYGSSAGSQNVNGRIVIKWSRIMRPDNVSASIDSYASDQFGRSGIAGQVDNNYLGGVTSSILLSTIPLVTTIVANAITNANNQTTTISGSTGSTTTVQTPINTATQVFAQSVGKVITDITKNAINTQPMITLDQGTRVKVLVNKDIKLPTYKSLTKSFGSVSSE
jgi:type IV secretion system protein VirB10